VNRTHRTCRAAAVAALAVLTLASVAGCTDDADWDGATAVDATGDATATGDPASAGALPLRADTAATEYVGITESIPLDPAAPEVVLAPLFDPSSDAPPVELGPGVTLTSDPHPKTSAEVVLSVTVASDAAPLERTVAMVPASSATGAVYVDTVRAALARNAEVEAEDPDDAEPVLLEYRSTSAQGGHITLAVVDDPGEAPSLEVTARTPTTSIEPGRVNTAAYEGAPYESLYGLVWFGVSRDQFDFFVNRAYGLSAGKSQNFNDFQLVPHNWLRLTVTPELDQDRVDVAFEVVTLEGDRVPLARAPASLVAGEQFMRTVYRQMDAMAAAEEAEPGSSTPWKAPFYYDDPEGGGVVEVIAQGEDGESRIAYAVESPVNELTEVDFVAYQGVVEVPEDWDAPDPTCAALGSEEAAAGVFDVTFVASSTVAQSPPPKAWPARCGSTALRTSRSPADRGRRAGDLVRVRGCRRERRPVGGVPHPRRGARGDYQLLGFMDVDANADPRTRPRRGRPGVHPDRRLLAVVRGAARDGRVRASPARLGSGPLNRRRRRVGGRRPARGRRLHRSGVRTPRPR
jgi:hypothetical protein